MKVPKKVWVYVLIVVGISLVVVGVIFYRQHTREVELKRAQEKAAIVSAQKLDTGTGDGAKFAYYVNLGQAYEKAGDYDRALEALLNADKNIGDRSVKGFSANLLIAKVYTEMGNKDKAHEYYARELSRLKGTGSEVAEKYIRELDAKL